MAKLYIMCGLAFSGKSTLSNKIAEHTGAELISFDKMWVEQEEKASVPERAEGWKHIRTMAQEKILSLLKNGHSAVYDENNPRKEHRDEFRETASKAGAEAFVVYLDTPIEVIRNREMANRTSFERHEVAPENFEEVLSDLEIPTEIENTLYFTPETNLEDFLEKLDDERV